MGEQKRANLDAPRSSTGQRRVARACQVTVRGRGRCRRADKTGAAVALVAVLDSSICVVRRITSLDARRGRVVGVLSSNNVGEDAGRDVDRARIYRAPVERDGRSVECYRAMRECECGKNEGGERSHVGRRQGNMVLRMVAALMKARMGDSGLHAPRSGTESQEQGVE